MKNKSIYFVLILFCTLCICMLSACGSAPDMPKDPTPDHITEVTDKVIAPTCTTSGKTAGSLDKKPHVISQNHTDTADRLEYDVAQAVVLKNTIQLYT